ncbi:MAG: putative bifunctional diguanylate cyclase/phosphodiesterase [Ilumatobacter sp.]
MNSEVESSGVVPASTLAAWTSVVDALPIPAAIITADDVIAMSNRWLDVDDGTCLLAPRIDGSGATHRLGLDGDRWRVRSIDANFTYMLATREREDAGDHLMREFFSSGDVLFVVYDQSGRIIQSNAAWERLLGLTSDEVFGMDTWTLTAQDESEKRAQVEIDLLETGKAETQIRIRAADGTHRDLHMNLQFDSSVGRCIGFGRDVTEEGKLNAELERRAFHDELTGLFNRSSLLEHLEALIEGGGSPALLFCDMDRFKIVNDSLGHAAGDLLLADLGRRLREVDLGDDARLARFGGDEFVVVLASGGDSRARLAAVRIQDALRDPFDVAGRPVHVTMSIGISSWGNTTRSAEELIGQADTAAYEAKARGRKRWIVFDEKLQADAARRLDVESGLRQAIAHRQIEAFFQPIVSIGDGRTIAAEALVRWRTPERVIAPGAFLDVAEDAGLMPDIGRIMIDSTIATAAHLQALGCPISMSINVSDPELKVPGFCDALTTQVADAGLKPSSFLIEITESAVLATDPAVPVLRRLRDSGFRIALDDFGTGFSSLAHLRELPIDVVKVDRSFVADLTTDTVTHALTASLVDLCHALDLNVVMEGIETTEQADAVLGIGASVAQGYLFHRPMTAQDLEAVVRAERTTPVPVA